MSSRRPTLTLPPQNVHSDSPRVREVLEKAQKQVGFVPNMYAGMVNSPGLLETYLFGYERFRKESGFSPTEQEVVFLTISRENGCHYCVAAHSALADRAAIPTEVTDAIRAGRPIADPKLRVLSEFTRTLLQQRGWVKRDEVQRFLDAGFIEAQVLEIVLAIAVKTLSNWSNHLFDTPVDEMFAGRAWAPPQAGATAA